MRDIYNRRNSIQWIQQEDIEYPEKLRPYKGMPKTLYVLGGLPDPSRPSVAVVGARRSTSYGDNIADSFRQNWPPMEYRSSAVLRGELIQQPTPEHWKVEVRPMQ